MEMGNAGWTRAHLAKQRKKKGEATRGYGFAPSPQSTQGMVQQSSVPLRRFKPIWP